jgi:hypothetical protein
MTISSWNVMNKFFWLIAILLFFLGPVIGVYLGIHPGILPLLGIVCGLVAIVRGAQRLPDPDSGGAASGGAQADAKILSNTTLDSSPHRGIGITDVGGTG